MSGDVHMRSAAPAEVPYGKHGLGGCMGIFNCICLRHVVCDRGK